MSNDTKIRETLWKWIMEGGLQNHMGDGEVAFAFSRFNLIGNLGFNSLSDTTHTYIYIYKDWSDILWCSCAIHYIHTYITNMYQL